MIDHLLLGIRRPIKDTMRHANTERERGRGIERERERAAAAGEA